MSFSNAARLFASTLPPGSAKYEIMHFLITNAVGSSNAVPWSSIEAHLESVGIKMSQQSFQHGLLADTRSLPCFIGSYDKGKRKGYFIIDDIFDAELMRDWYLARMAKEQYHLDKLRSAAQLVGWQI
jgi:hypothetical protein